MSIFKRLFGSVNELKESVEQKEITNKINNLYESIVKGVEELNVKVNSVKELKEKLKNLPPPPPEKPKETSSSETNKPEEKKTDEKTDKVPLPAPLPPMAVPPKPATSSSGESGSGSGSDEKPNAPPPPPAFGAPPIAKQNTDSSPLPMHGAAEVIPPYSPDSLEYDGGKKRKTRAKAKRTISKNKNNSNKRTRKNKNKDKETTPESANTEAAI
jgi:hypothetical protein